MTKRRMGLVLLTVIILIAVSYISGVRAWAGSLLPVRVDAAEIETAALLNRPEIEMSVDFFEQRVSQNPQDAVSLSILGGLYAQEAWRSDNVPLYQQAVETQEAALALLPGYDAAEVGLASAQLAIHQFEAAYELGTHVYEKNPKRTDALAIAGDAALAMGRYEEAEAIYQELARLSPSPQTQARLAHLAELNGHIEEAIDIMHRATQDSLSGGQDKYQLAWYLFRLGDLYFDIGRFDEAEVYMQAALDIRSDYPAALGVMAELAVANGQYQEAIGLYEQELALGESIGTLAALGDLHALLGQRSEAEMYYDAVEEKFGELVWTETRLYGRQLAAYYADHNFNLEEALALTEADLAFRQDVQGYDSAAWVYYKLGDLEKAQEMMALARQLGTDDAGMLYHAGMIALARGETAEAANLLAQALDINPAFDPIQATIAQQTLSAIQ